MVCMVVEEVEDLMVEWDVEEVQEYEFGVVVGDEIFCFILIEGFGCIVVQFVKQVFY